MKKGFDCDLYLEKQADAIIERINGYSKLYLEFGGKLFDDFHAARVLPGFEPGIKIELLKKLKDQLEIILCINAKDIEKNKVNSNVGLTYDMDLLRLIDNLRNEEIQVCAVVITLFTGQPAALTFKKKLERQNIKTYIHTFTKGYPTDVDIIVSDEGYGSNPYIETTKPIVIVTAPGASSGKLATCLSQLYHDYKRGIPSGYAKYETFPIWNLPLKHPVNIAYEAATADLKDVNMIDSFHLEAYGEPAVNYNRDLEVFPILKNILEKITGTCVYKSPTDMGVNMTGFAINNDDIVKKASREEIIRRYYKALCDYKQGLIDEDVPQRIKVLMNELNITLDERPVINSALEKFKNKKTPAIALKLSENGIITGRNTEYMTAAASVVLNAIKDMAKIDDEIHFISPNVLEPMMNFKRNLFGNDVLLNLKDVLTTLSISTATNPIIEKALAKIDNLKKSDAHSSHIISKEDKDMLRVLGVNLTEEPDYFTNNLYK